MKLYKLLSKLTNEILPLMFWILLLFGFDKVYMAIITILSAVLHELGHYIAITALKCDTGAPIGHISGFRIRQRQITSYTKNVIIFACGPLSNFAVATLLFPFSFANKYIFVVCVINFATAISNLLPIKGYDGYSILAEIIKSSNRLIGVRFIEATSFCLCTVLTFLSLYMMYYRNGGYWLFGLFIVNILSEMSHSLKTTLYENN